MDKATFQGLFNAEVNRNFSFVMPVKQMLYDLAAWVHRAIFSEVVIVTDNITLTANDSRKIFLIEPMRKLSLYRLPKQDWILPLSIRRCRAQYHHYFPQEADGISGTITWPLHCG
jgi:hypothetical protein